MKYTIEGIKLMAKQMDAVNIDYILKDRKFIELSEEIIEYTEEGRMNIADGLHGEMIEFLTNYNSKNLNPDNVTVGQGVTQCLFSDRHAFTVIKKTAKSITIQRDNATINFKPEFSVGGFAGHCTNNEHQEYTYEKNPQGETMTYRWSEKKQRFQNNYSSLVSGRREKYDYNF